MSMQDVPDANTQPVSISNNGDVTPFTLNAVAANPIEALHANNPEELTPLRAHYLKKSLIQLQFEHELAALTTSNPRWPGVSTLSYLGPPFRPLPKDAPKVDLPFLRYMFHQFVLTFPFMAAAPKDFYSQKLQPFVTCMIERNLSSAAVLEEEDGVEKGERAAQKKLLEKVERNLSLFLGAATKLVEKEEVVRLTQADLDRLEVLSKRRQAKLKKNRDYFEVNIVSVRTVVDKGRVRSRAHDEFIIRTRRSRYEDVYVSRRYGDFRTLASELQKAYPEEHIPPPPQKDRTFVTVSNTSTTPTSSRPSFSSFDSTAADSFNENSNAIDNYDSQFEYESQYQSEAPSRLAREKNRLTLRSYLHTLMSSPTIALSPVFRSFLLSGPTTLSAEEREDARRREEADRMRDEARKKFAGEIAARVDGLREAMKSVKGDIMGKDGLTHVFGIIKVTPDIRDLPLNYKAVVEWARISLASTVFQQFVASDNASQTFAGLKRIHGLMPYFMLKAALKVSNPIGMIRSVLDLFLAQPFGGKSLLQRMFTSSLTEEVKQLQEEIEAVKDKVDDLVMCEKVRQFIYAPREIQEMFKADAVSEKMNIFIVILRSGEQPSLTRPQMHRLARAHRAHAEYLKHRASLEDSDDDDGPQDENAWLLEDLKILAFLYARLRDRETLIDLIFEGFTAELLKDIITIFYTPLAQVYRAASIADSLGDLQNFVNDLIKTVEQVEESIQHDPHYTVQAFIDLIERHEQSFYYFVHKVHSKGEGLFNSLMHWIELFLTVVREGLGEPLSLEFLLPHTGRERMEILKEVDEVAVYHYKLKVMYEDKLRKRFGNVKSNGNGDPDMDEDEATRMLVTGVMGEIDFGGTLEGDALDIAAEETDSTETDGGFEGESGESEESEALTSSEYSTSEETGSEVSESETGSAEVAQMTPRRTQQRLSQLQQPQQHQSLSPHSSKTPTPRTHLSHKSLSASARKPSASPNISTTTPATPPALPRKRSFSLTRMRSLTFNNKNKSVSSLPPGSGKKNGIRNDDKPLPPVPPLPSMYAQSPRPSELSPTSPLPPIPKAAVPVLSNSGSGMSSGNPSLSSLTRDAQRGQQPSTPPSQPQAHSHQQRTETTLEPEMQTPRLPPKPSGAMPAENVDKKNRKKHGVSLKPPELQSIPQLLPVFIEMMRPALRVRKMD